MARAKATGGGGPNNDCNLKIPTLDQVAVRLLDVILLTCTMILYTVCVSVYIPSSSARYNIIIYDNDDKYKRPACTSNDFIILYGFFFFYSIEKRLKRRVCVFDTHAIDSLYFFFRFKIVFFSFH